MCSLVPFRFGLDLVCSGSGKGKQERERGEKEEEKEELHMVQGYCQTQDPACH